jgi:hypothetical protein
MSTHCNNPCKLTIRDWDVVKEEIDGYINRGFKMESFGSVRSGNQKITFTDLGGNEIIDFDETDSSKALLIKMVRYFFSDKKPSIKPGQFIIHIPKEDK